MTAALDHWLAEHGNDLVALRRHLHAHPELSYAEHATTDLLAERLTLAGLAPQRVSSGTGLVVDIDPPGGVSGLRFGLRADIDALGMQDEKDVPYRSQVPGVSHACGHDVHTTVMLGVATYWARHRDLLPGPVRVIFQPAEEVVPSGAQIVVGDGHADGIGAMVGFHCDPHRDVGTVGLRVGPLTSACDTFSLRLTGPGGHTARPGNTVDLVQVAARVVTELPERVAGLVGEDAVRLVFGAVHAGSAANVIPAECTLRGTVRTPDAEAWERLPQVVAAQLDDLLAGTGAGHELAYTQGVPPVVNDAGMIDLVRRVAGETLGEGAVGEAEHSWGGDDFAWYGRRVPIAYVRLGVRTPGAPGPELDLHAGHFDADEDAIGVGIRVAVGAAHRFFG